MNDATLEAVLARSLVNCHARGVDSIVLAKDPMVRLFVANAGHELWRNMPDLNAGQSVRYGMSVAFHPHHCDLTLTPVYGAIFNLSERKTQREACRAKEFLFQYRYVSPITSGQPGSFVPVEGNGRLFEIVETQLTKPLAMRAKERHSMWVPIRTKAAWLVEEGGEDPNYVADCWSNADLTKFDFTGMYRPMHADRLREILALLPDWVVDRAKE
jgi:hypothetical protein